MRRALFLLLTCAIAGAITAPISAARIFTKNTANYMKFGVNQVGPTTARQIDRGNAKR
jgi:hypothetical protein